MGSTFDFGTIAGEYDLWYNTQLGREYDREEKEMVRTALRNSGARGSLLEIGCGTGHWCEFFIALGFSVSGVDISSEMLERAKIRVPSARLVLCDAESLPFADGEFDAVAAITVLEFTAEPHKVLKEAARCLRPGGVIIIGALHLNSPLGKHLVDNPSPPYSSGRLMSKTEISILLTDAGFASVRVTEGCRLFGGQGAIGATAVHAALARPVSQPGDFLVAAAVRI